LDHLVLACSSHFWRAAFCFHKQRNDSRILSNKRCQTLSQAVKESHLVTWTVKVVDHVRDSPNVRRASYPKLMSRECERVGRTGISIESSDLVDSVSVIANPCDILHATDKSKVMRWDTFLSDH
jgi:hypothetical protein